MAPDPERSVIALASRHDAWSTLVERGVTADMFHNHREVWEWLGRETLADGVTPDIDRLRSRWTSLKVPGTRWSQVDGVLRDFLDAHVRRSMATLISEASDLVLADRASDALDHIMSGVEPIVRLRSSRSDTANALVDTGAVLDHVSAMVAAASGGGSPGVETGLRSLNRHTGGPKAGELWILGARLGVGKTWMLVKLAVAAAMDGEDVLFMSLEQPTHQVSIRIHQLLAAEMGFKPFGDFVTGNVSVGRYRTFLAELKRNTDLGKLSVVSPKEPMAPGELAAHIGHHEPGLVLVDYLTRLKLDHDQPDWRAVGIAASTLKDVAMSTRTPLVVASQLNRTARDTAPDNDMLSRSDTVGQDADGVLMLTPFRVKGETVESVRKLTCTKYRHGRSGWTSYLDFRPGDGVVSELTQDQARDQADAELAAMAGA